MNSKSMFTMGFSNAQLGCCGYDDLAVKPATTSPISDASRLPAPRALKSQIAPPRFSQVGSTSRMSVLNLPRPEIGLLQKGRREGRS